MIMDKDEKIVMISPPAIALKNINRNKKIVMISPPAIALKNQIRKAIPPFGLLTVGATVEERGYENLLCIDKSCVSCSGKIRRHG